MRLPFRAAGQGADTSRRSKVVKPVLTGRALVLGAVLILLVVVLAAPVARYLGSRSGVAHAAQQLHDDRDARRDLRAQKARYSDPGYVQAQARKLLQFAMPGDTVYTVVRSGQRTGIENTTSTARDQAPADEAWTGRLWGSVEAAGR